MTKRFITAIAIVVVLLATPFAALAQSYSFSLDKEEVHVFLNEDSSISLDYTFVFTNDAGAHDIDFVDVGMPNSSFDTGNVSAEVDGTPVNVSIADYQGSGSGFAVVLGTESIQPGETGTVQVTVERILWVLNPDTGDASYASFDFGPTWFGSDFVHGNTDLTVAFHLPPGVQPDEPRFHVPNAPWTGNNEPVIEADEQDRIVYTWQDEHANGYTAYVFGASFPVVYVPAYATQLAQPTIPPPTQPVKPTSSPAATDSENNGCTIVIGVIILLMIIAYFAKLSAERNDERFEYARPQISIEGYGIKRGLTAVEAAVLLDEPLDKVLTMILFGVVKKGAAKIVQRDPLQLDIAASLPEDLYAYEKNFLDAFRIEDAKDREEKLQGMFISLIKSTTEKLRGFDSDETKRYYRGMMQRAWQQVREAGTPEVKNREFDQSFDWLMLDHRFGENIQELFADSDMRTPQWWDAYDQGFNLPENRSSISRVRGEENSSHSDSKIDFARPVSSPRSEPTPITPSQPFPAAKPVKPSSSSLPGAEHAASIVNSVQDFSSRVIRDMGSFTERVHEETRLQPIFSHWKEQASRPKSDESFYSERSRSDKPADGLLDWLLSSNSSSSSSSSSSSHRSSSSSHRSHCACACAGCACACAGGGR